MFDDLWLHSILALVGEDFQPLPQNDDDPPRTAGQILCGAAAKCRTNKCEIELWLSTTNEAIVNAIGQRVCDILTAVAPMQDLEREFQFEAFAGEKRRHRLPQRRR
eukprot:GHVT01082440.1.p2 GENE.GHVT01082440.1~~GHVT01082440.1.p2  ORF type:complete len:106 (+),score=28.19 GHVT01082440.1:314-631(+)